MIKSQPQDVVFKGASGTVIKNQKKIVWTVCKEY